jgi:hypothetical protein
MAAENLAKLLSISPFLGMDSTSSDVTVKPGVAKNSSNADTSQVIGALSTARGRTAQATLTGGGVISYIAPFDLTNETRNQVMSITGGASPVLAYNPDTSTQYTVVNGSNFTQAVQYSGAFLTNAGQQINSSDGAMPAVVSNAAKWQYTADQDIELVPVITQVVNGSALPVDTYYYAFTVEVSPLDGVEQETSPLGGFSPYPYSITTTSGNTPEINITTIGGTNIWNGYLADGTQFDVRIYRQSMQQPVWHDIMAATFNGAAYVDTNSNLAISANQELDLHHDPPPQTNYYAQGLTTYGVIFAHKERMWSFVLAQDGNTSDFPECQLWYSDYGVFWSFNDDTQVLLVGEEDTTVQPASGVIGGGPYGDFPMQGVSLSSVGVLLKNRTVWILYGDDETTFNVRKVGNIGCVSMNAPAVCETVLVWLTQQGFYEFDGLNAPQYISEEIRDTIEAIPVSDQANSVGWYSDKSYFCSFPATGITLWLYLPTKQWKTLPYAMSTGYSNPFNATTVSGSLVPYNQVIGVRPNSLSIDAWGVGVTDLGSPVTATWLTPLTVAGSPGIRKICDRIVINAPIQPGAKLIVTLRVDPGVPTTLEHAWSVNLGVNSTTVITMPPDLQGFLLQMELQLINAVGSSTPAIVYSVEVLGAAKDTFIPLNNGAVTALY